MRQRKEYAAAYASRVTAERVAIGYAALGGKCRKCGEVNDLEFDHIDPSQMSFRLRSGWGRPIGIWMAELAKCQLLCRSCHQLKSIFELGKSVARGTHGTISAYRYCKCDECKRAKREWQRSYRATKRLATASLSQGV